MTQIENEKLQTDVKAARTTVLTLEGTVENLKAESLSLQDDKQSLKNTVEAIKIERDVILNQLEQQVNNIRDITFP
jgi:hypothetical protein